MKQASYFFWGLVNNPSSPPASPVSNRGNPASKVNSYLSIFPTGIHCMSWKYLDCTIASSRWRLVRGKSPDTNITFSVQTQVHCHSKMCKILPCLWKETTRTRTQPARAGASHGTRWTWPTFLLSALSHYGWSHLSPVCVSPSSLSSSPPTHLFPLLIPFSHHKGAFALETEPHLLIHIIFSPMTMSKMMQYLE